MSEHRVFSPRDSANTLLAGTSSATASEARSDSSLADRFKERALGRHRLVPLKNLALLYCIFSMQISLCGEPAVAMRNQNT